MNRQQQRYADDDDYEIIDGQMILRDRRSLRVPLHLMDGMQRDVSRNNDRLSPKRRVTDGSNDPLAMNRPGQRVLDGVKRDMRCYDEYDARKAREYLGADATDSREGDPCTVRSGAGKYGPEGSRGTMQMINGVLTCVGAPPMRGDARNGNSHAAIMDQIYSEYDAEIREAYRRR
jgi:hypothetical protein